MSVKNNKMDRRYAQTRVGIHVKTLLMLLAFSLISAAQITSAQTVSSTAIVSQEDYLKRIKIFRIGTGGTSGTYYPIGGMVAQAISNPPGSRPCSEGGSCGVPGLVAIAQSSNGSVSNIHSIAKGELESGFAQSDVVYWAYTGKGVFKNEKAIPEIRAIANLYPETLHLVARKGSGIKSVHDLRGKKVSLDESGSGTLIDARLILNAYDLKESDLKAEYIKPEHAIGKIERGELDAFFIVTGYPTPSVSKLASGVGAQLIAIGGKETTGLLKRWSFFSPDTIPENTYPGIPSTPTISVGAQWIVSAKVDENLVYQITKALWNATTRQILNHGHTKGKVIEIERALEGIAIPLHPGAERFYREMGMLP
ncbi:TAXI family TRAP transporter solute-binding subunit [Kiloniella antarctica]|uniref:TAXI family TRAP transporter solute-binding subunit n=1 Tax=Kiloniella antarctica TaxID=1550907 RepID=A0ABW5BLB8_9PROT